MAKWTGAALMGCVVALTVTGCGGSTDTGPMAAAVQVVQAPPASVANGALLPVEVQLVDSAGGAVSRSGVEIRVALGGGQGTIGGAERAWTDGSGRAAFSNLSVAGPVGTCTLTFSSPGVPRDAAVTVQLTTGPAASIRAETSIQQSAPEVSPVPVAPTVRVSDVGGNPVAGTSVTFAVRSGSGTITGGSVSTGADGLARLESWILGDAGSQSVTASAGSLTGSPVVFQASATPSPVAISITTQPQASVRMRTSLTTAPAIQLLNARGNPTAAQGVPVTVAIDGGAGSLDGTVTRETGPTGAASFPGLSFTGLAAGTRSLVLSAAGLAPTVSQSIQVNPGPASQVVAVGPVQQSAEAYTAVGSVPSVAIGDLDGNPVLGAVVTFVVTSGGGSVAGGSATSAASGVARVASWTLGAPGPQALEARAPGLVGTPVTFTATATMPAPAALRVATQPPYSATVGVALSTTPAVQLVDAQGRSVALPNVSVTVAMTGGGGSLAGTTTQVSDAAGRVSFPGLSFAGLAAGSRGLTFMAPGLTSTASTGIQVYAGPAAQISAASTQSQTGTAYRTAAYPPAVLVQDSHGNPVPGTAVTFAVTLGGGSLAGAAATTAASGVARVTSWTFGGAGDQEVRVTATGLTGSPVVFRATAQATDSTYRITLRYLGDPPASQRQAFEDARGRLEQVITGDLPDIQVNVAANARCGNTPLAETVDDLLIFVQVEPIDGPGNILGQAGPCYVRTSSRLPVVGVMRFDSDDLAALEAQGTLGSVILHEMMHVVGFGTIWRESAIALLAGAGTTDPYFTGSGARDSFQNHNGGGLYSGIPVPVENTGGAGTADSHWRESVFRRELMTGWISIGSAAPMSRTTISSLEDIGYSVDVSQADPFDLASAVRLPGGPAAVNLVGDVLVLPLLEIDEVNGVTRPVRWE